MKLDGEILRQSFRRKIKSKKKYNPHIPNIDAISGALFTLRIHYEHTQTQCCSETLKVTILIRLIHVF